MNVILGAGIAGISAAYHLYETGIEIVDYKEVKYSTVNENG